MPSQPVEQLNRLCQGFRRKMRTLLGLSAAARMACLAILLFAGVALVDWRWHLPTAARLEFLAIWLVSLAAMAWWCWLLPLRRRWTNNEVLAWLDARFPEGESHLVEMYELAQLDDAGEFETDRSRQLAESSLSELPQAVSNVTLSEAFAHGSTNRGLMAAGALVLVLVACTAVAPNYVAIGGQRFFNPFSTVRWPHRTMIAVAEPANGWTVPQLESFTVAAKLSGEVPVQVTLAYRTPSSPGWIRQRLPVADAAVMYTFPEVREPVEFTLAGGDYETDLFEVAVIHRPYLKQITAHYHYPSYLGLADRTVTGGQLNGIEGTTVRLEFESSMPLDSALVEITASAPQRGEREAPESERRKLERRSDTHFETTLMLTANGQYSVELYEANGYREARPEIYEIRVTPDELPEIELHLPGQDLVETSQATIDVAFTARDQLGLAKVEFYYQIDDRDPRALSTRMTGPVPQSGSDVSVRFPWRLKQLELPEVGTLRYFVRVQDNNPTGRGVRQSATRQVKLVKPSEFHLEALEQAKLLEEEARIAWRNQLQSWHVGGEWLSAPGSGLEDPVWNEMQEAQEKSFRAAEQMKRHLQLLTDKYERNDMARDFMAGRLSVIAELTNRLVEQEHGKIRNGLDQARPKTDASAAPEQLRLLRQASLQSMTSQQKMAVLMLERMLRKLYDWRDLQTSAVTTKLLREQQTDVQTLTEEVAPKTIAKEIEDLSDDDQERLLTLGKQQRAIFDAETGLETQLTYLMYKAERQQRKSILDPLQAAFGNLRNNRVNHHLKRAAEMIENNQPSQIIDNQRAAVRALNVVEAGLLLAGQTVDDDEPLTLAMIPSNESQFDPDLIKPSDVAQKPPEDSEPITSESPVVSSNELPVLPEGSDALSATIRLAVELEDNTLGRTRYLEENRTPAEMPRFVQLKLLRLTERQSAALEGLAGAIKLAETELETPGSEENPDAANVPSVDVARQAARHRQMLPLLAEARQHFLQSARLLEKQQTDGNVQQVQADAIAGLEDLLQQIAFLKSVDEGISENVRLGGVDAFGRPYVVQGVNLTVLVDVLDELGFARCRQAIVLRHLGRFQKSPAAGEFAIGLDAEGRRRAQELQQGAAIQLQAVLDSAATLSPDVARLMQTPLKAIDVETLTNIARQISDPQQDEASTDAITVSQEQLADAIGVLRELLEERVAPEPTAVAGDPSKPDSAMQVSQFTSREELAELLKSQTNLSPEVRDRMVRALAREFPEKYRELLKAYFASFVETQTTSAPKEEE